MEEFFKAMQEKRENILKSFGTEVATKKKSQKAPIGTIKDILIAIRRNKIH